MAAAVVWLSLVCPEDRPERQAGHQSAAAIATAATAVVATPPASISASPTAMKTAAAVASALVAAATRVTAVSVAPAALVAFVTSLLRKSIGRRHCGADKRERR